MTQLIFHAHLYIYVAAYSERRIWASIMQENFKNIWGWTLPQEDYDVLSSRKYQKKYFDGDFVISPKGPYHNYEELWDEPKP